MSMFCTGFVISHPLDCYSLFCSIQLLSHCKVQIAYTVIYERVYIVHNTICEYISFGNLTPQLPVLLLGILAAAPMETALEARPHAAAMSPVMLVRTAVKMWLMCVLQVRVKNLLSSQRKLYFVGHKFSK